MYLAKDVALRFVAKGIAENNPVTQMQLQKLVFFAHGVHLANEKGPLIKERFEAWQFGPVIPALYDVYKLYGSSKITDLSLLSHSLRSAIAPVESLQITAAAQEAIDVTWDTLKGIDAIRLSNWTHLENSPWHKTFVQGANKIIPNEIIKDYFAQNILEAKA